MRTKLYHEENILLKAFAATRRGFISVIFFSFFINVLAFIGPLYMLQVYDRVLTSRNEATLLAITLIAAFLLLVYATLEKVRSKVLIRLGALFDAEIRSKLFDRVLVGTVRQPGKGHHQALRDVDVIREFLTGSGLIAFFDAPWVPIFVAGCFILHPWFGWIATGGALLIFSFTMANELLTRKQIKEASRNAAAAGQFASATFRNSEVLYAMGMVGALRNRWLERHNAALNLQASASDRAGGFIAATKFARASLQIAVLGIGAFLAIRQETSPGAMIAASIIVARALSPVETAVSQWKSFISARAAYERIQALLAAAPAEPQRVALPAPRGRVSVENLSVGAPDGGRLVLKGVTFTIEAGTILGVIGPSAAGKSSLARALTGVWQPRTGAVRLDGAELSHWNREELGVHMGYLPQDVELFSGTIAENIARFSAINHESLRSAAAMAGVHDMIQNLPEGYNTAIGESGVALSGGQRQRIGLARALYGSPSLVILDEPNSNLDSEGEIALLSAIKTLKGLKRTVILVTHKTNILAAVDKILVMAGGQVQAMGDTDEIFARVLKPRVASVNNLSA